MKNVSHNQKYNLGTVEVHLDPPLIPLTKIKNNENSDKDCVKIKLRRNPTTQKLDLYQFKMIFFDNGYPEEFFYLIRNFNMTIEASGMLVDGLKIQYLCTLVCVEELRQFDIFYDEVGSTTSENLKSNILGLGMYSFFCECAVKTKARDASGNKEATYFKSNTL